MGCSGAKGQRVKAHEGQCTNKRRTEIQYGSFCKRCYINHLCERCGANAYKVNETDADEKLCTVPSTEIEIEAYRILTSVIISVMTTAIIIIVMTILINIRHISFVTVR